MHIINNKARWPSGKAKVCNTSIAGSNPARASGKTSIQMSFNPDAGWSSLEARRAHNPEVIGSNPVPATINRH